TALSVARLVRIYRTENRLEIVMGSPRLTPLVANLPSTVPFTGPETLELQRGKPFKARIGANESSFGPAPSVLDAIQAEAGE
ncbi:hypothetical protein LNK15_14745, partial [Jeotgalicoccus huakuii]|nr:hypothetical protein [Jeotgalicoccus huakuii]